MYYCQNRNIMWTKLNDFIVATFLSCLGYLSPVKGIVHMMIVFFLIDIYYGWRADKKVNNARFCPKKIWDKTIPRMLLSFILLIAAFILDNETGQHWISVYRVLGWFISSLLIISIARNGYLVTKWSTLKYIGTLFERKVKHEIGVELKIDEDEKSN